MAQQQHQPGIEPDRIDVTDAQQVREWAHKLDTTEQQVRDAVQAVGSMAGDVELHLKGVHSTTNADRVQELGG